METVVEVIEEVETNKETEKAIVVFNDDVNSFDHVISCLVAYCEQTFEQAEQCASIIHHKGKYAVKCGSYDELKPIKEALTEQGLDAIIS